MNCIKSAEEPEKRAILAVRKGPAAWLRDDWLRTQRRAGCDLRCSQEKCLFAVLAFSAR
jgi:hypothetical protein